MLDKMLIQRFRQASYEMRKDILDMCLNCGNQKGHLGGCMSAVDILAVLYLGIMNITKDNIQKVSWEDRDRFVLSKGHAGMALYAALRQAGVLSYEQIHGEIRGEKTFLYRHPKYNPKYGIECSVGSLGMGIGYAVGLAEAMKRKGKDNTIFCMLGDGECEEGSVWESFAYAAHRKLDKLTVIIDKNGLQLDGKTCDVLDMNSLEEKIKAFGFSVCTIDGHNYEQIYGAFQIEHCERPLAIIASTIKGKGVSFAENKTEWHDNVLTKELYRKAIEELELVYSDCITCGENTDRKFDPILHEKHFESELGISLPQSFIQDLNYKNVVGVTANEIAKYDANFSLIYSDCANRIEIEMLRNEHPEMCYETGIAEQNQLMVATALAQEGFDVFAVAYAPFITARVLDQIRANLGYMKSPVKLIGLSAGFSASDLGATHTALEDITDIRCIPNMTIICPADCAEIAKAMIKVAKWQTPVYIRITNSYNGGTQIVPSCSKFEVGKANVLCEGTDVAMISCGAVLSEVLKAAKELEKQGISCKVINMHTIKPLDKIVIQSLCNMRIIVTIEEHSILGGLGGAVAEYLASNRTHPPLLRIGVPDKYYKADFPEKEMGKADLLYSGICMRILEKLNKES